MAAERERGNVYVYQHTLSYRVNHVKGDLRKLNVKILISLILLLIKIKKYFAFDNKQCLSLGTHIERKEYRFRPGFKSQIY